MSRLVGRGYGDYVPTHAEDRFRHPVNEGEDHVQNALNKALRSTSDLRIITGYSSLETIITTLVTKCGNLNSATLVFGNEPSPFVREATLLRSHSLTDEAIDYWYKQGVSPRHCSAVLKVIELIENGILKVRFHHDPEDVSKILHAKIVETDTIILTGSSNFSQNGLTRNREYNTCFRKDEPEESQDVADASGFVQFCIDEKSTDCTDRFAQTLRELLANVTWEQALSRAIHALLRSEPGILPNEKSQWDHLLPHQKEAVVQALGLMESHGGAIVADPTGSGKTLVGTWVTKLALRRFYARNQGRSSTFGATVICPTGVQDNWEKSGLSVGENFATLTHDSLGSSSDNLRTSLRDTGLRFSPIVTVDEIHNFYGKGRRTKRLKELSADQIALLTATPINRQFSDVIKLLEHFFGPWATSADLKRLRELRNGVKSSVQSIREDSRASARMLIQPYMVRRTRSEIQAFVNADPEGYHKNGRRFRYPEYHTPTYEFPMIDEEKFGTYATTVSELSGLERVANRIEMTNAERQLGLKPGTVLRKRLESAKGLSQYNVWKAMDSSAARFVEHISGSAKAQEWIRSRLKIEINLSTGTTQKTGVINKLQSMTRPELELDLTEEEIQDLPDWLVDDEEFNRERDLEIQRYQRLLSANESIVAPRDVAKLDLLVQQFASGQKVLAFDHSICTVNYYKAALQQMGVERLDVYSSAQNTNKKKLVADAEEKFGKDSDFTPRVGLMNDLMSEGINLQGANVLIHLTTPTTIRQVEQRVGRIDRMDTPHDSITVFYPSTDLISDQMRPHLKQRHELVDDLIKANIQVPEDLELESKEVEIMDFEIDLERDLSKIDHGIRDAYASVRELVGDRGILSESIHAEMEGITSQIISHVSFLKSDRPWALICYSSRSRETNRWVLLDYDKKEAEVNRGIITDLNEICDFLVQVLPLSENIVPNLDADRFTSKMIDHLSRCEYFTLPQSQRKLADFLRDCCDAWTSSSGLDQNSLSQIREAVSQQRTSRFDTSALLSEWNQLLRGYLRHDELQTSGTPREFVIGNPPYAHEFDVLRSSLRPAEQMDTRIRSMIVGIPP